MMHFLGRNHETIEKMLRGFTESSQAIDLTEGNIRRIIVSFTIPIIIGNLFQQLYSMADTAVVERGVSANALAAVGTNPLVTQLLLGLMIGMASGMSVVIARHFSSGDEMKAKSAIVMGDTAHLRHYGIRHSDRNRMQPHAVYAD